MRHFGPWVRYAHVVIPLHLSVSMGQYPVLLIARDRKAECTLPVPLLSSFSLAPHWYELSAAAARDVDRVAGARVRSQFASARCPIARCGTNRDQLAGPGDLELHARAIAQREGSHIPRARALVGPFHVDDSHGGRAERILSADLAFRPPSPPPLSGSQLFWNPTPSRGASRSVSRGPRFTRRRRAGTGARG